MRGCLQADVPVFRISGSQFFIFSRPKNRSYFLWTVFFTDQEPGSSKLFWKPLYLHGEKNVYPDMNELPRLTAINKHRLNVISLLKFLLAFSRAEENLIWSIIKKKIQRKKIIQYSKTITFYRFNCLWLNYRVWLYELALFRLFVCF